MRHPRLVTLAFLVVVLSTAAFGQSDRDKGIEQYRAGNFARSIELLEPLLATGDADYTTGMYLAASYVHSGNRDQARSVLSKLNSFKAPLAPLGYDSKIKYVTNPKPYFGEAARRTVSQGSIKVLVEFKHDGTIGFVLPFGATSDTLTEGAITAAKSVVFEPATINGKPVNVINILQYRFARY